MRARLLALALALLSALVMSPTGSAHAEDPGAVLPPEVSQLLGDDEEDGPPLCC